MAKFNKPLGVTYRDEDGLYATIWIVGVSNAKDAALFEIFEMPYIPPRGQGLWPDEKGEQWKHLLQMGYFTPESLARLYEGLDWEDPDWRTPQYWEKIKKELEED